MTFLFLGLDAMDHELVERFDVIQNNENIPFELSHLEQDMRDRFQDREDVKDSVGHWTFYLWPAIASGQIETPEMRTEHPLPDETEWPLKWKYLKKFPKSFLRYAKGRLTGRPRYKSFVWDEFENVKVINFPVSMPEYNENADLIRDDAISRNYGPKELDLLRTEINTALAQNYDAIFVVTRFIDTTKHGATQPSNYGAQDHDEWFEDVVGRDFESVHEEGVEAEDFIDEEKDTEEEFQERGDASEVAQSVMDHVREAYENVETMVENIMWDEVDEYVVISDHGFQMLGAGSVNAHSRHAVLASSLGEVPKMSQWIQVWRERLEDKLKDDQDEEKFKGRSQEEEVKEKLEALGYM